MTVNRRAFLGSCSIVGIGSLAGCLEDDPTEYTITIEANGEVLHDETTTVEDDEHNVYHFELDEPAEITWNIEVHDGPNVNVPTMTQEQYEEEFATWNEPELYDPGSDMEIGERGQQISYDLDAGEWSIVVSRRPGTC